MVIVLLGLYALMWVVLWGFLLTQPERDAKKYRAEVLKENNKHLPESLWIKDDQ